MNSDNIIQLLIALAGVVVVVLVVLIIALVVIHSKEKREEKAKRRGEAEVKQVKKSQVIYTYESIEDFMDFEKIEDNMIIQKNGKFLMVVECQGINYDLMSEMEKVSVEQGFISFLNTLRHPIQLYIQTRTINLERSVDGYKNKLKDIERKYNSCQAEYENLLKNDRVDEKQIDKAKYELIKQKNLKEYAADIIRDIERQSLNKNILSKKYYVIIPCYSSEIATGNFDKTEIINMAFSELYTRARAIINALFTCQVSGKILNSEELIELLYIAYNRDESDLFWIEKMKKAGFDELYSTAPDVMDRKMKLLDKQIEEKSISLANQKISEARRDKELQVMEKEKNEKAIVNKKAKELIAKHRRYIGEEVTKMAIEKIDGHTEEKNTHVEDNKEETQNEIVQEKSRRGRPRKN